MTDQAQTITLINNTKHRSRPKKFTRVKFGLYRGATRFAVQGPTVDIIHEPISEDANPRKCYNVLVGRKSDGLFSIYSENYGWTAVMSYFVLSVFCAFFGLGMIIMAFFPNDKQKSQKSWTNQGTRHSKQKISKFLEVGRFWLVRKYFLELDREDLPISV